MKRIIAFAFLSAFITAACGAQDTNILKSKTPAAPAAPEPQFANQQDEALRAATDAYYNAILKLESQGATFSEIMHQMAAIALQSSATNGNLSAETATAFRALQRWTEKPASPMFQGRQDWPLHFIYGGMIATTLGPFFAEMAAYEKERRDAAQPGNYFDLDDYCATLLGLYWADSAGEKSWLEPWASGAKTLDASIPALQFGHLPPGELATQGQIAQVKSFAAAAIAGSQQQGLWSFKSKSKQHIEKSAAKPFTAADRQFFISFIKEHAKQTR